MSFLFCEKLPEILLANFLAAKEPANMGTWLNLDHENFDITSESGEAIHLIY